MALPFSWQPWRSAELMTLDVMLTLALVALLTLSIVALLAVRASLRADIRTLVKAVGELRVDHGQQLRRMDASLDTAFARIESQTDALFDHEASPHPKPPARKKAAKKAPAKKAQPRPRPGKSAPR